MYQLVLFKQCPNFILFFILFYFYNIVNVVIIVVVIINIIVTIISTVRLLQKIYFADLPRIRCSTAYFNSSPLETDFNCFTDRYHHDIMKNQQVGVGI